MTTHTEHLICPAPGIGERLPVAFSRLLLTLRSWAERSRQRRALAGLTDRALADIGITRYEAEREADRPFWEL